MGPRRIWALALGVLALVLFGFWVAPRLFPDMGWGLDELNQVAGIASAAMAAATLAVSLWPAPSGPAPAATGGVTNTLTGDVAGTAVQAHTIHGGVGNTNTGPDTGPEDGRP